MEHARERGVGEQRAQLFDVELGVGDRGVADHEHRRLRSESGCYAATFLRHALAWFEGLGIRCKRLLTDNAKCYAESRRFQDVCQERGIQQRFTRPYTPRTNGKAERFIQTLKRRWAYRYVFKTSAMRAASLRPWLTHYNHRRPHRALGKKAPMARLREARQQAA
jgi:transposase InsO family protein